jgi:hypothetical protein
MEEMMPDAATQQPNSPDNDAGQVAELCIAVMQDGSLQVYKEQGEDPAETESARQTASDIGQALKMVLDMYKQMGQGEATDQMTAGFDERAQGPGQARMQRGFR